MKNLMRCLLELYIIPIFGTVCWNVFLYWAIGPDILLEQVVSTYLIYFWCYHIRCIYYHRRATKAWEDSVKRREEDNA